jgi:hypothetical protein
MTTGLAEELLTRLSDLPGKRCWSVYDGPSSGSDIDLDFGTKFPRAIPILGNSNLTEDQKFYTSEVSLFVQCAWRLDASDRVICGSGDSNTVDGPMLNGLRCLVGRLVESIDVAKPGFDLVLQLTAGLVLRVFCDQTSEEVDDPNYTLHTRSKIYAVGPRGQLQIESLGGEALS